MHAHEEREWKTRKTRIDISRTVVIFRLSYGVNNFPKYLAPVLPIKTDCEFQKELRAAIVERYDMQDWI